NRTVVSRCGDRKMSFRLGSRSSAAAASSKCCRAAASGAAADALVMFSSVARPLVTAVLPLMDCRRSRAGRGAFASLVSQVALRERVDAHEHNVNALTAAVERLLDGARRCERARHFWLPPRR